jgi:CheY-like chemotaxis protein
VSDRDRIGRAPRAQIASRDPEAASSVTSEAARPAARGDDVPRSPPLGASDASPLGASDAEASCGASDVAEAVGPSLDVARARLEAESGASGETLEAHGSPDTLVERTVLSGPLGQPRTVLSGPLGQPRTVLSGPRGQPRTVLSGPLGQPRTVPEARGVPGADTPPEARGVPGAGTPTARHVALTLEGARRRSSSDATRRPTAPLRGLQDVELLVVDDDDDARWLLARYLERAGARVRTAGSVREAEEALARRRPHALVSDIGMPFEDGRTLVARLRHHEAETGLPRLPAIAVTAFVGVRERDASLAAGFDAQLAKPLDPARLVVLLRSLLA